MTIEKEMLEAIKTYVNWDGDYDKDVYKFRQVSEELYDERRWTYIKEFVIHEQNSNRYFSYCYEYDACESCEGSGAGFLEDTIDEVEPVEVKKIVYKSINRDK